MGIGIGSLVAGGLGVGSAIWGADKSRKAANRAKDAQKELIANLKYEPIDIEKLKADTTQQSINNARQSIALEQELAPDVAAMRTELPRQVSQELAMGGRLSPDVANQIASQARVVGAGSGNFGGGVAPLTAALTGTTAQALKDSRQQKAASVLAMNQLPTIGLDPGSLASLEAQQNAALNQFNLSKAGINSNMINSSYGMDMANIGATQSAISSLGNLLGAINFGSLGSGSTGALVAGAGVNPTVSPSAQGSLLKLSNTQTISSW